MNRFSPVRGPWQFGFPGPGHLQTPSPAGSVAPDYSPPEPGVSNLPFVDLVAGEAKGQVERLRRSTQKMAMILNSLIRRRQLVFEGDVDWTLDVSTVLPSTGLTELMYQGGYGTLA